MTQERPALRGVSPQGSRETDRAPTRAQVWRSLKEEIAPRRQQLARCRSTQELRAHPAYLALEPLIRAVLETPDVGSFSSGAAPAADRYRVLAWNIERGSQFEGQLEAFRSHPYLRACDVLLLTEADVGMARSGNRAVAQELARELGLHYAFVPCYLNLTNGSGIEHRIEGENEYGLHGNAILSRYPITRVQPIRLRNGVDKMATRERRIGCQSALAAQIEFPNSRLTAVSVHLDAQSTQRHRSDQMRDVIGSLPAGPAVLGGDWNTTTYNSSRAFYSIMGFWLRVLMGVDHVIRNHYLHPYHRFEKDLFALLEQQGFDYRRCNQIGEHTISYSVDDRKARQCLGDWVPWWCFPFIRWALRNHGGKCPLKIDWFATRGVRCENPVVIHDLREGRAVPLSDHDAIGLDVIVEN